MGHQDTMDLFQNCRRGDLEQVMYLTEQKEMELNIRDKWDSTPLYYACLCGHFQLVKYLLERGAVCDSSTFDGERCVYGALTNDIKELLLKHKMLTPVTMRREAYTEFLRRLLMDDKCCDVEFNIRGEAVTGHKCILSARSPFLKTMFEERWRGRTKINLNNKMISKQAFKLMMEWLYTGQVKVNLRDVEDLTKLVKYCHLQLLVDELEQAYKKADSFVSSKRGAKITTLYLDSKLSQEELQQDLGLLAQQALPLELRGWQGGFELPGLPAVEHMFEDVIFQVENFQFYCHKPIFFARSEYFRALLDDHFDECQKSKDCQIPTVHVNQVSPIVFSSIVSFVYTNSCDISEEYVSELIQTADMFLLPGLKKLCGKWMVNLLDTDNVLEILLTARLFKLVRLEDQCVEFIAANIEQMYDDPELHRIIESDASEVQDREEIDSIAIIDEIRSHIRAGVCMMSDMEDAELKMNIVENILTNLGLSA